MPQSLSLLWFGLLLGIGAAVPIGPVNLEIIRRNLHFGTCYGLALGFGACVADITYLLLLSAGALTLLNHILVLRIAGLLGACILAWFAWKILSTPLATASKDFKTSPPSFWRFTGEGYFITLINPYTILFWASVSTQVALTAQGSHAALLAGLGVFAGTLGWVLLLNLLLKVTRHYINQRCLRWLNISGGMLLLGFSIIGLWHAIT